MTFTQKPGFFPKSFLTENHIITIHSKNLLNSFNIIKSNFLIINPFSQKLQNQHNSKQIKKSLMATWEDLDNESESDNEEAEDEAKIAMALVATDEMKLNHLMLNPVQILKLKVRYILNSPDLN